ncbi:MAG: JAB domain-containing protein [Clostridia bacterium]|nr:JAB domain-containing protein [Clostridia bacterium]
MAEGHRERVLERFGISGFAGMSEAHILEMLLFYSIPRRDTRPIADELLKRFGSLSNVLKADQNALQTVPGVGKHSAVLIKMTLELTQYILTNSFKNRSNKIQLATATDACKYALALTMKDTCEHARLIMLDSLSRVLNTVVLSSGSMNSVIFDLRAVVHNSMNNGAHGIIIVHNHPSGIPIPSGSDNALTAEAKRICEPLDIKLCDHLIVADEAVYSSFLNRIVFMPNLTTSHTLTPDEYFERAQVVVPNYAYKQNADGSLNGYPSGLSPLS